MTAGLYGLIAALCWGSADFIARFTGRSIGHQQTIFGMIAVGTIALSLVFWWLELEIIPDFSRLWLLVISGVGIMYSTMLLYKALAMGPVTIVSPIVGSFPVFNVILAIILGARPDMVQWAAVISVLGGVWIVSYAADHFLHEIHYNEKLLRQAVLVALSASLGLGISVAASQEAARHYGELQTICASRWIGLITISLYFVYKKVLPRAVLTCWPLLTMQGLLDTTAYVVLMLAAHTSAPEMAVVTSSGFCVVTIILARIILKERMRFTHWVGVIFIVSGVSVLSATT